MHDAYVAAGTGVPGDDRQSSPTDCSGPRQSIGHANWAGFSNFAGHGDCDDPVAIVAAAESRSALDSCLELLQPDEQQTAEQQNPKSERAKVKVHPAAEGRIN